MAAIFNKILEFIKRERVLSAAVAVIILIPLIGFAALTPVKAGTRTVCKYSHTLQDDSVTKWVFRWTADSYKVIDRKIVCGKHKRLEELWAKAKKSKKEGDYKKASSLLKSIKASDPNFPQINQEIAIVAELSGEAPPADNAGNSPAQPTDPTPPAGDAPAYSGELVGLFPSSLAGYRQTGSTNSGINASRTYAADAGAHPNVLILTIQLDQAGTEAGANEYIDKEVKGYYAAGARSASINGLQAYFGTDGRSLAVLAYQIGGVAFTLEMRVAQGNPGDLYGEIIDLARNVP